MSAYTRTLQASRALRAAGSHSHQTTAPNKASAKHWFKFGNPWRDDYPQWIWQSLRYSRKDKDIFAPLLRIFNSTKIYDIFLKDNRRYCMFVMGAGLVTSWMWSEMWNSCWRKINKGVSMLKDAFAQDKLYNDVPYVYPEED